MKFLPLFLFLLLIFPASAQKIIKGNVVSENGEAIAGASVFINNSLKGTTTNSSGYFELSDIPAGQHELVISSIGYETSVYSFNESQLPLNLKVQLKVKIRQLQNVTVAPYEVNGWQKWGKLFMENFVGSSANAQHCKITNYKTIKFRFSRKENQLTAIAFEPLIIENRALGYKIQYQLEQFNIDFTSRVTVFLGYPLFEEIKTTKPAVKKRWEANRKTAYKGSIMHFMRSLYTNKLAEEGFEVRRLVKLPNAEKQRVKKIYKPISKIITDPKTGVKKSIFQMGTFPADSVDYYETVLEQADFFDIIGDSLLTADSVITTGDNGGKSMFFKDYLKITYKNETEEKRYLIFYNEDRGAYYQRSALFLVSETPITIEKNGSYFNPQDMYSLGYWAWSEKMADFMPLDYEAEK